MVNKPKNGVSLVAWVAGILFCLGASIQQSHAGTIILEGSDAIGFHSNVNAFATTYRDQVWSAIGGSDSRPIAVIGGPVSAGVIGTGTHAISLFTTVGAAGTLTDYVALYFLALNGCCVENDSLPAGNEAAISAYLTGGGTVMIENYIGGAAWDFAVGAGGVGNGHVSGVGGGHASSLTCDDGELVTADGTSNGFSQPGAMSCWTHQGYDMAFFAPLGFTHNFFDSPASASSAAGPGEGPWSSLLSSGVTVTGAPEPSTVLLLGAALLGLGFARRRT